MDERRKRSWPLWTATSAIALPVLYALSIGPVAKLNQTGVLDDDTMILFCKPLMQVLRHCPDWIVGPVAQYLALWGGGL